MSAPSVRPASKSVTIAAMTAMVLGIVGLQVGLPWLWYRYTALPRAVEDPVSEDDEVDFWYCRTVPKESWKTTCQSVTVCGDELIALIQKTRLQRQIHYSKFSAAPAYASFRAVDQLRQLPVKREIVRCHLKTGKITTAEAPAEVAYVMSDGKELWWLPYHSGVITPFLRNGRPAALVTSPKDPRLCQLLEFSDDRWKLTEDFALIPDSFDVDGHPQFSLHYSGQDPVLITIHPVEPHYLRPKVGSEDEAKRFIDSSSQFVRQMQADDLQKIGWKALAELPVQEPPIDWDTDKLRIVSAVSGQVYAFECGGPGELLRVMTLTGRTQQVTAERGGLWSEFIRRICSGAAVFMALAIAIPVGVLTACAWCWQRRYGLAEIVIGERKAVTAPIVRRAVARSIDLLVPVMLVVASYFSHPGFLTWWNELATANSFIVQDIGAIVETHKANNLGSLRGNFTGWYRHVRSIDSKLWLQIAAACLWTTQVVWQGCTGQTAGKWLMGIKVVQTTLRPCGIARSLLRELFIPLDAFPSWLTGVISILVTARSQRIGDRLADTIVVRAR